jgi:hypothetical protein
MPDAKPTRRKSFRWRREPHATGLAGICQGERGWQLRYGEEQVGTVAVAYKGGSRSEREGYYWYARSDELGVPLRSTAAERAYPDAESARADCLAWVKMHMEVAKQEGPPDVSA